MKKQLLITFLWLPVAAMAAPGKTDSLKRLLRTAKDDTSRVKLLNELGKAAGAADAAAAMTYGREALSMAYRAGWQKGKVMARNTIGNAFANQGQSDSAIAYLLYALEESSKVEDKILRAETNNNIGVAYLYGGDYANALKFLNQAFEIRRAIGDKAGMARVLNNIGTINQGLGNHQKALENFRTTLALNEETGNLEGQAGSHGNMGIAYQNMGNYTAALEHLLLALRIDERTGDKKGQGYDHNGIGTLYHAQGNYTSAMAHFERARQLLQAVANKSGLAATYNNMGMVYYIRNQFSEALESNMAALKLHAELGDRAGMATNYNNIGINYNDLKRYDDALHNYDTALRIYEEVGDTNALAAVHGNIALVYEQQGSMAAAEQHGLLALAFAEKAQATNWAAAACETLSKVYKARQQYKEALKYYEKHVAYRDSLVNIDNTRKTTQLQDQYEYETKEAALKAVHERTVAVNAQQHKSNMLLLATGGGGITLALVGGLLVRRRRERDRLNLRVLETKQEALIAQLDTHFISDTIAAIQAFVQRNERQAAGEYLGKFSRLIRKVLESSQRQSVTVQDNLDLLHDYFTLARLQYPDGHVVLELNTDPSLDAGALMPPMILQVLTENAMQHAFTTERGGVLRVTLQCLDNEVRCSVEDNGIGRQAAMIRKQAGRRSYGTELAESLAKVWDQKEGRTTYTVTDLVAADGTPAGTRAEFCFPYVV